MDRDCFKNWLDSYGQAWTDRDAIAAAELYTDDATYQVTPFDEPIRGRAAIREYWEGVARTEQRIKFEYELLAVTAEYGIAQWKASFIRVPPGLETKLNGIFLVSMDSNGRCRSLHEWWHKLQ
jgi:uncharacterized protein (TIGR02246 family)